MNTPSWTYDSGYPSIFQGEGLNRSGACLKSHRQALIHFFKSTWKKKILSCLKDIKFLGWLWLGQMCDRSVPVTEKCVRAPFSSFNILEPKSGVCEAVPDFSFCFSEQTQGTFFLEKVEGIWSKLVSWESSFVLWLLLIWRWMYAIPVDCIKNILKQILPPSPSTPPSLTHSHALFPSPSPKK